MSFQVIDPSTGKLVREVSPTSPDEVERALALADKAFRAWRRRPFDERADLILRAAQLLEERADALSLLMAGEMGKPVTQGRAEIEKCARVCEYYAREGEGALRPRDIPTDVHRSRVVFEPLGVILSIMPWNFPFWQVFRFAAPSLMAGNAVLLKHAPNVPGCAAAAEEILLECGAPEGLFQALYLDNEAAGALIDRSEIRAVTLTGSTRAGRAVAARAGGALKKTVLELGGSDPYLVLEDADLDRAVEACLTSRFNNSGQSCIAAKRLLVVDEVRKSFEEKLLARLREIRPADPCLDDTRLGPLAREDLREELHRQVVESVEGGARLRLGGVVPEGPGWFYPATLLTGVAPGIPAWDEELFGPVAVVIPVKDEEQAIRVANDSPYGLGAGVFTGDVPRGERIVTHEIEAGLGFVNDFVTSDPRLPFGGIKDSGYGRELGEFGIREFVNVKTIVVR